MAGSEARAAWQRTANRFRVQEDPKRALKLTCYQTSSASLNHIEAGLACSPDGAANFVAGFASLSSIPLGSNLLPESRWWIQLQPIFAHQRALNPFERDTTFVDTTFCLKKEVQIPDESCLLNFESWQPKTCRDEFTSFVARKSTSHIENCGLPQPARTLVRPDSFSCYGMLKNDVFRASQRGINVSDLNISKSSLSSASSCKDFTRVQHIVRESDFGRAQLIEALCHSQTRAREAENKAKKAKSENEHLVKILIFIQASQVLAYKQILNLSLKAAKQQKRENQATMKHVEWIPAKFMVAVALGFCLVGTGLLLGWTIGWILPILTSF